MPPKKLVQRLLAVALVATVVALTTGSLVHFHSAASSEATCQVCHISHASAPGPSAPAAIQSDVPVLTLAIAERVSAHLTPFRAASIPRAPPA
jgi:hypothetical protein